MSDKILEVIACTIEDAVEAERGGADRLEVISRFDVGGLTPSPELVREIKARVSLPLRVMLRESEGFATSGASEINRLCELARTFERIGVDGLVVGFLRNGTVDLELTATILGCAPDTKATFHHAFEDASDQIASVRALKSLPQVDRILAHGGAGSWDDKIRRLAVYAETGRPEIGILAGGGLDGPVVSRIAARTSIAEFHVGTAARLDGHVSSARVARLADIAHAWRGSRKGAKRRRNAKT